MTSYYESERALAQYLWLHYGEDSPLLPAFLEKCRWALGFPKTCASWLAEDVVRSPRRALDVGCAVGRAAFELSRSCDEVLGIDISVSFIRTANRLREGNTLRYELPIEGDLSAELEARMPNEARPECVRFVVGDAMALDGLGEFDLVLAANLLCRLPEPKRFLARLSSIVRPGGRLLLTTPASWLEQYTPRENWIGGFLGAHGPVQTFEGVCSALHADFELVKRGDLPLLIPEHARKYELIFAEATLWSRRA
ncbi:MAG: putative 4-mercaptohistidine N1-methyltransferase [Kiritimatiellae bacterium]|nr:putative 4-mercaptohistidine N1-methyltransferase [Kiritimatiellia bacterium]MDW8457861.1 putative 4-mercaptohistidine N1-methyltransferase [Verrucomicrobiota bacterium]